MLGDPVILAAIVVFVLVLAFLRGVTGKNVSVIWRNELGCWKRKKAEGF